MQVSKSLIESLQKACSETHGTSLITYYIQPSDVWLVSQQLCDEMSSAQNIKDKNVRKAVIAGLKSGIYCLKNVKKIPENGLVLLSGDLDQRF